MRPSCPPNPLFSGHSDASPGPPAPGLFIPCPQPHDRAELGCMLRSRAAAGAPGPRQTPHLQFWPGTCQRSGFQASHRGSALPAAGLARSVLSPALPIRDRCPGDAFPGGLLVSNFKQATPPLIRVNRYLVASTTSSDQTNLCLVRPEALPLGMPIKTGSANEIVI